MICYLSFEQIICGEQDFIYEARLNVYIENKEFCLIAEEDSILSRMRTYINDLEYSDLFDDIREIESKVCKINLTIGSSIEEEFYNAILLLDENHLTTFIEELAKSLAYIWKEELDFLLNSNVFENVLP